MPNDNIQTGGSDGGRNQSLERTSEANLDTQSCDISAVEIRRELLTQGVGVIPVPDSLWGKKLHL